LFWELHNARASQVDLQDFLGKRLHLDGVTVEI
jgi:hypothetical protein